MDDFKNQVYSIEEFLELVKSKQDRQASFDPNIIMQSILQQMSLKPEMKVFIGDPLDIGEHDNEILPDFVFHNKLHYMCSDENIQDVVDLAFKTAC